MNEHPPKTDFSEPSSVSGEHIARLLQLAGPRPSAPQDREERVMNAVRERWLATVRSRRRRTWFVRGGLGLAAAALLAAAVGLMFQTQLAPEPIFEGPVARVEAVFGSVTLTDRGSSSSRELRPGDIIQAGSTLDTGILGRAAVRLVSGSSLRLDQNTRLRGLSDAVVALDRGALYFDSGAGDSGGAVEVRTTMGTVHDIGTQFEVRVASEEMRVRVREGAVNLDRNGEVFDAGAGMELRIDSAGELSRREVPIFGPEWEWILAVAPPFELEGRTLESFLTWVVRETGWRVEFEDPSVKDGSPEVILHGSVSEMPPGEALGAVLPTCGLQHRLEGGTVLIRAEGSA